MNVFDYAQDLVAASGGSRDIQVDAAFVTARLEEAGATLLALPSTGYSTRLKVSHLDVVREVFEASADGGGRIRPPVPSAAQISRMDEALGWIVLIPRERTVLRRIVGARSLVSPVTERHLFSWRRLGGVVGADHKAVQRWHAQGIEMIVAAVLAGLNAASGAGWLDPGGLEARSGQRQSVTAAWCGEGGFDLVASDVSGELQRVGFAVEAGEGPRWRIARRLRLCLGGWWYRPAGRRPRRCRGWTAWRDWRGRRCRRVGAAVRRKGGSFAGRRRTEAAGRAGSCALVRRSRFCRCLQRVDRQEGLLFERSRKKVFVLLSRPVFQRDLEETKVFWFFFSKKNCLPCVLQLQAMSFRSAAMPTESSTITSSEFSCCPATPTLCKFCSTMAV